MRGRFSAGFLVLAASFSVFLPAAYGDAQFPIRQLPRPSAQPGLFRPATAPSTQPAQPAHPAVARVIAPEKDAVSYGSGTLIDARGQFGLVVTNWHVVRDATGPISVQFPDGFKSVAQVVKTDKDWDLAALSIQRPNAKPVTVTAAAPQPGEQLTIGGYGPGEWRTASGRCTQYLAPGFDFPHEMVELAAEARQGDSGGPIFNQQGELAGVLFGSGPGYTSGSYGGRVLKFLATVVPGGTPGNDETSPAFVARDTKPSAVPPLPLADAPKPLAAAERPPYESAAGTDNTALTPAGAPSGDRLLAPPPPNRLTDRWQAERETEKNEIDSRVAVAPDSLTGATPSAYFADRVATNSPTFGAQSPLMPRITPTGTGPVELNQAPPDQLLAAAWRQIGGTTMFDQTKSVLAIVGVLALLIVFWRVGRQPEPEHHED